LVLLFFVSNDHARTVAVEGESIQEGLGLALGVT
jgi:hypothetical protein